MGRIYSNFIMIASMIIFATILVTTRADSAPDDKSFSDYVFNLQNDFKSLCSYIGRNTLSTATEFRNLIRNAHIYCPNMDALKIKLSYMENMASQHISFVKRQSDSCQELSNMLLEGLENGDLLIYYLKEGNYSLVTSIIDKWHEAFTNFASTFYIMDIPIEIMLSNAEVFYYDMSMIQYVLALLKPLLQTMQRASDIFICLLIVYLSIIFSRILYGRIKNSQQPQQRPQPTNTQIFCGNYSIEP